MAFDGGAQDGELVVIHFVMIAKKTSAVKYYFDYRKPLILNDLRAGPHNPLNIKGL